MSIYKLPKLDREKIRNLLPRRGEGNGKGGWPGPALVFGCFVASFLGMVAGMLFLSYLVPFETLVGEGIELPVETGRSPVQEKEEPGEDEVLSALSYEQAVTSVVDRVSPSVVSIVVTKEVPVEEYYFEEFEDFFGEGLDLRVPRQGQGGTEEKEVGGGTGFIVSSDGMILTNKHVVMDKEAEYAVFNNEGERFEAEVLARDPVQDIGVLKIEAEGLPVVELGDSDSLKIGQTAIAIGNVLGEFRNSVSVGVISGLRRDVAATGGGVTEMLEDIIQTDAAINQGNSGGPLLNLKGEVVGINTAMAVQAENVGFAIPINHAKRDIDQVKEFGEIVYPFLGIYYTMITPELQEAYDLPVKEGAWIGRDRLGRETGEAIFSGSPAEKVGLQRGDIITEMNGEELTLKNTLAEVIGKYSPGDRVELTLVRGGDTLSLDVTLSRREE